MPADTPADLLAAFLAAVNARDLDGAIELWREDAVIVQPDGQPLRGREAVADALRALIESRVELQTEVANIVEAGDIARKRHTDPQRPERRRARRALHQPQQVRRDLQARARRLAHRPRRAVGTASALSGV